MSETSVLTPPHEQLISTEIAVFEEALALEAMYAMQAVPDGIESAVYALQEESDEEVVASRQRVDGETYSHSTLLHKQIGELAIQDLLETEEGQAALHYLRECWESSIIEMLQTDPDFRSPDNIRSPNKVILEITRRRIMKIVNDRVMANDGVTDMEKVAMDGEQSALMEAKTDPRMIPPAIRAGADRRVAKRVPTLKDREGMSSWTVYPKKPMIQYGKRFYESLGFREGLSFLQGHCRAGDTIVTFAYSVDFVDPEIIREVWAEEGCEIPPSVSMNTWLDHQIDFNGTPDELHNFMERVRARIYEKAGITAKRYSMDQFIADNKDVCDQMFSVYLDLTTARKTGQKTEFLQAFVDGLLENTQHMHPGLHVQLIDMQSKSILDKNDVARLEELNRYATVEHLRDALALLGTNTPARAGMIVAPNNTSQLLYMARSLAGKVHNGIRSHRTYGGCTRSSDLFAEGGDNDKDGDGLQKEGGGESGTSNEAFGAQNEACIYSHTGCYCSPYDADGSPLSQPMRVWAVRGADGIACCLRVNCEAELMPIYDALGRVVGSKPISKGNIYALAQAREAAAGKKRGGLALIA